MRWKAKYINEIHRDGDTRLKRVFAWLPHKVSGDMLWLEYYEVMQIFKTETHHAVIDGKEGMFKTSKWINVSERIMQ